MANIRLIKRRIKSASNISQITRAMEMVAASKMKKAQETALMGKPYSQKIYEVVKTLASRVDKKLHPLLSEGNPEGKKLIILISTNKGLCGSLNTNLFRMVHSWMKGTDSQDFITIGKKGESFLSRSRKNLIADFSAETAFINTVPSVTKIAVEGFVTGKYSEVFIAYNNFVNVLKQNPVRKILLPISRFEKFEELKDTVETAPKEEDTEKSFEYIIEPSVDDVLDSILPHYIENQLRSAVFESEASEHSARMIAMKNATDAALDFMESLTLLYNKARQEKITYEISDIITAKAAFE